MTWPGVLLTRFSEKIFHFFPLLNALSSLSSAAVGAPTVIGGESNHYDANRLIDDLIDDSSGNAVSRCQKPAQAPFNRDLPIFFLPNPLEENRRHASRPSCPGIDHSFVVVGQRALRSDPERPHW